MEKALRTSWQNLPPDQPERIEIDLRFTPKQYEKLSMGMIPAQMEDKWFIFMENDWLYFHRSWTGFCIYKAQVKKDADGYLINEFWAERNPEKYNNTDDSVDIETFHFLTGRGLLGIDFRETYFRRNINSEEDSLRGWSNFGNLLFSEKGLDLTFAVKAVLFGVATGDALGVPVEFRNRETLRRNPVREMLGYGTHNMPPGTWSDDSSMTFCLAEALTGDFDLKNTAENFTRWFRNGYWTATGKVFDIGKTTMTAIKRIEAGIPAELAGSDLGESNGNGSLMRILPLVFYLRAKSVEERFELTRKVSSITHRHMRSVIACFYYLEFALKILSGTEKSQIFTELQNEVPEFLRRINIPSSETDVFHRLFKDRIGELPEERIHSSGYVVHTLEASIWCLLTTGNFSDAVLRAVNLGEDTDTTGAVTGGLAALYYGSESIPAEWRDILARKRDIEDLADRLGSLASEW